MGGRQSKNVCSFVGCKEEISVSSKYCSNHICSSCGCENLRFEKYPFCDIHLCIVKYCLLGCIDSRMSGKDKNMCSYHKDSSAWISRK